MFVHTEHSDQVRFSGTVHVEVYSEKYLLAAASATRFWQFILPALLIGTLAEEQHTLV